MRKNMRKQSKNMRKKSKNMRKNSKNMRKKSKNMRYEELGPGPPPLPIWAKTPLSLNAI